MIDDIPVLGFTLDDWGEDILSDFYSLFSPKKCRAMKERQSITELTSHFELQSPLLWTVAHSNKYTVSFNFVSPCD